MDDNVSKFVDSALVGKVITLIIVHKETLEELRVVGVLEGYIQDSYGVTVNIQGSGPMTVEDENHDYWVERRYFEGPYHSKTTVEHLLFEKIVSGKTNDD